MNAPFPDPRATRQPVLNLPPVVSVLIAVLLAIHVVRVFWLSQNADIQVLLDFAFIPLRTFQPDVLGDMAPGGARLWSFLTYAFLHADWAHVGINCVWIAAFGTPVARRFGAMRFLALSAVGAIAGAILHLAINPNSMVPMVGASAAISAQMAAACRFVFQPGGPLWGYQGPGVRHLPASSLVEVFRDRRAVTFIAVWFGINLVFGLVGGGGLSSGAIAWDAHIGGFVAGLLLFPLFDPVPPRRA